MNELIGILKNHAEIVELYKRNNIFHSAVNMAVDCNMSLEDFLIFIIRVAYNCEIQSIRSDTNGENYFEGKKG